MPPTENQNTPPAPTPNPAPAPVPTPPPSVNQTPVPPVTPPPTGGIPPKKPMNKGALIALIIGGVLFALLVLVVTFNAVSRLQNAKRTTSDASTTVTPGSSVNTTAADLNCGVKITEYPTNPGTAYVQPDNWPKGFNMHDTGDEDSIREYCQGEKLKARAEEFVSALSGNDWTKAFSYLSKAEAAATTVAVRSNQWNTEYGAYDFSPANYPLENSTSKIDYGIETCRKDYSKGWSKEMKNGYYRTPVLAFNNNLVTTQISLAMTLEDGVWKVVGDNNELFNVRGVVDGDAYSNAQADRKYSNFYDCQ